MAENSLDNAQLHYVETAQEAYEFVEWCKQPHGPIAIDTETTGLENDARIRLIQFGSDLEAWTLRWDRYKGPAIEALEILKKARVPQVFHNSPFDVSKIEAQSQSDNGETSFKFDWGLIEDTMILSRLSQPVGSHSLKNLAMKHVDRRSANIQTILADAMSDNNWTWETVPYSYEGYSVYAGLDTILTARLLPVLKNRAYSETLYETEMTVLEACTHMSATGMLVDIEYCVEQASELEREIADIQQQGRDQHHFHQFGSNQMLVNKFAEYNEVWEERTKAGRVAVDADVLGRIEVEGSSAAARNLATLALGYRVRVKLLNTYFKNLLADADSNNRVHPQINTIEAVTGRMTVNKPAMQTLPRGPRVRQAFIPDESSYYVLCDYAQIEMRLLAHFSEDPGLLKAISSGDLHSEVAKQIYGPDITGAQRQLAKTSAFAIIYGAGPEKFSHTAGVSMAEGSAFLDAYHEQFNMVRPFINQVQRVGKERGRQTGDSYVTTPAGRKLSMRKAEAEYTLVNYLIQGSAADVLKKAIQRIWHTDLGPYMRLPVHDEMIFEIPLELDSEEVMKEISETMQDEEWAVPLVAEAEGPYKSWADKYNQ